MLFQASTLKKVTAYVFIERAANYIRIHPCSCCKLQLIRITLRFGVRAKSEISVSNIDSGNIDLPKPFPKTIPENRSQRLKGLSQHIEPTPKE